MNDQPTAPQPWDTLPDDPDAIPFPIVVGWDASRDGTAAFSVNMEDAEMLATWTRRHGTPDWWMPWPTFTPDPMTVVDNHPMHLLPDGHDEVVWIKYTDGRRVRWRGTFRSADGVGDRESWCSEAAMVAEAIRSLEGES